MNNGKRTSFINEEVYQSLRRDIVLLRYLPGTKLSENSIAVKYGVSRAPVRLVFQRLAAERFVQIEPQRGTFVTKLDLNYIMSITYMRQCVETDMLKKLAKEGNPIFLEKMEGNLRQQQELLVQTPEDFYTFNQLDNKFHQLCYCAQNKEPLWEIVEQSSAHYTRYRMLDLVAEHSCQKTYEAHRQIYSFIAANQPEQLERAIHDHLYGNLREFEAAIQDRYQEFFFTS